MADPKPTTKNYLHAFTLYQETKGEKRFTSEDARTAYTTALKAKGYRPWRRRRSDNVAVHLPQATMIGPFRDAAAAVAAVKAAEKAASDAHPRQFFPESSIVTLWTGAHLDGPPLDPQPPLPSRPKPAPTTKPAPAKPSQAAPILSRTGVGPIGKPRR